MLRAPKPLAVALALAANLLTIDYNDIAHLSFDWEF